MNGINQVFTVLAIVATVLLLFGTIIDNNRISGRHTAGLAIGFVVFAAVCIYALWGCA